MHIVNIHEAKTHLSQLIAQMLAGEEIIIGKAGQPIAKLVPFSKNSEPRKLGGDWEGRVWMADDFDDTSKEIIDSFYNSKLYPDEE